VSLKSQLLGIIVAVFYSLDAFLVLTTTTDSSWYCYFFYSHCTHQPALPGTPVRNWRILLEQSFTVCMPLL